MCFGTILTLNFSFFPIRVIHGSNHDCLLRRAVRDTRAQYHRFGILSCRFELCLGRVEDATGVFELLRRGDAGFELSQSRPRHGQIGLRLSVLGAEFGVLQADQDLTFLDPVTFSTPIQATRPMTLEPSSMR